MIASNVGELIEILKTLDQSARVFTIEPPFDGVKVVDCENNSFLIARPRKPDMSLNKAKEAALSARMNAS